MNHSSVEQRKGGSCLFGSQSSADRIHSPCSETTPASAGSSSDLRCCGLACLRRDMLLASVLTMLLLLRSGMPLRFADTSAKRGANVSTHSSKKKEKKKKKKGQKKKKREEKSSQTVLVVAGAERAKGGQKSEGRKNNVKLAGAAAAAGAVRRIAHVGIIIMIVNNASRLMAPCEGGEDWLESSGRALDMVMRDGLSN